MILIFHTLELYKFKELPWPSYTFTAYMSEWQRQSDNVRVKMSESQCQINQKMASCHLKDISMLTFDLGESWP